MKQRQFQPIAIVGQGCVLPGALNADQLWDLVSKGRDVLRPVDKNYWGVNPRDVLTPVEKPDGDKTWTQTGAYVDGFEDAFDASRFDVDLTTLDDIYLWTLEAASQAWTEAGFEIGQAVRGGFILGNLSYPTRAMSDYAENVWRGDEPGDPRNRYMSGLPSWTIRTLLGLTGNAFSLDAACASSLYAIKLACDALHDGRADVMLAGGVNHADDLFLHIGFCALNAMSRTGQSRPFHKDADGLIPAEGVAIVALKRLEDAEEAGDKILGVIRAIGVSNDGRGSGMLVPSQEGQVRAMKAAYNACGIDPNQLSYVECHATGTPVGDGIELESMAQIFSAEIPVGSMKSNTGHLITASGAAGLMKVLGGFQHQKIPPTIHAEQPLDTLAKTPFRLSTTLEDWTADRKIAAVNNFGFGGNNAHLVVEAYTENFEIPEPVQLSPVEISATAIAGFVGDSSLTHAAAGERSEFKFDLRDLRFPPNDLDVTLPQQLAVLETALTLKDEIEALPKDRTGVFIGMQTETEIARYGARWRNDDGSDGVVKTLNAAGVLGTMPNIVTNRLNTQFDLNGPSFSVSSDDASGSDALNIAVRAIQNGEIDAAIVGAVEMGCDPVHETANEAMGLPPSTSDACVLFIVQRGAHGVTITDEILSIQTTTSEIGYAHAAQAGVAIAEALIAAGLKETTREYAGPTVKTYPAHWSQVTFETRQKRVPVYSDAQPMAAAPRLPVVNDVSAWSTPIPIVAAATTSMVENVPPQDESVVSTFFEDVAQMHQQFLSEQTAMHQQFLGLQRAIQTAMEGGVLDLVPVTPATSKKNTPLPRSGEGAKPTEGRRGGGQATNVVRRTPVRAQQEETPPKPPVQEIKNVGGHKIIPSNQKPKPIGPTFNYEQIHEHASGKISNVYGPLFAQQDDFPVQVRMPEPPLLLCHRVTGIDCEPGVVGKGTLWCESDIPADQWFLHANRMPVGIMIESGQADLMLCSWMGADFENKGDRCYRLLGCELMFHGGLAKPGDVLKYDIHIDGHARQNDIRLFFFHYDLEIDNQVRLSVRQGQAGFFTYDELADSKGILWRPEEDDLDAIAASRFDAHPCVTSKRSFSGEEIKQFSQGLAYDTFGDGFERAAAHSATPKIDSGDMCFMDEVLEFDPTGGPWGRGYLKAVQHIQPDDWFFPGHFKNDPCMPGTLMFEGTIQTMSFFMAACGWTIERDGWIFEPVQEIPYMLRCRGQVSTTSKELIYEVFVREVHDADDGCPKLFADLLCTVDGLPAFHCARMGLQLTPDWPMDRLAEFPLPGSEKKGAMVNGFELGIDSLVACAWGKPTRAFGEMYTPFDTHRTVARLPGPPYHFMSRVTEIDPTAQNAMRSGVELTVEYDVPPDAWYFRENGAPVMPYAVLLEAALQPCGWLASYVGCALTREDVDLCFRNLDGTNTQFLEVTPETGTLRTTSVLKNIARAGGNIIVSFDVEMRTVDTDERVLTMDTVFGFFPPAALAEQVGLPITDEEREKIDQPSNVDIALTREQSVKYFTDGSPSLADEMLLMIDEVDFFQETGGAHGLGRARAHKHIDPREWFFKAHFFTDPVQPGSLGLEALLQLLQFAMIEKGLGTESSRFEALAIDKPMAWKYRGQVLTHNKKVSSTIDIIEIGEDDRGTYAIAEGSLWVDGMRIYTSGNIGMRIIADDTPKKKERSDGGYAFAEIDLAHDTWLNDHCPTYTLPALPAMSIVDLMAGHAKEISGRNVIEISDVTIEKWVIFNGAQTLRIHAEEIAPNTFETTLEIWWDAPRKEMSRYDRVARGTVKVGDFSARPETPSPTVVESVEDPYASGELFHGPAFQILTALDRDGHSARGSLSASRNGVPNGTIQPGMLDAALQIIPHDHIETWWPDHPGDVIAYPYSVERLSFYSASPTTDLVSEATFVGGDDRFVTFDINIWSESELWASMRLKEILVPKGPIGRLSGDERRRFIRDKEFVPGARLSSNEGELDRETVKASNWFKGTVESIYDVRGLLDAVVPEIVVKDAAADRFKIHPSRFDVVNGKARPKGAPVVLMDADGGTELDLHTVKLWWRNQLDVPVGWLGDDLYGAMIQRFVREVTFENLAALDRIHGRSVLFLGNHECQIESIIITMLASVLSDTVAVTMANSKHERGWVGGLIRDMFSYPGCRDPKNIVYFNQSDPASMLGLIDGFKRDVAERGASVMVHAPGTRAIRNGEHVTRLSSALLDMALELNLPIVPIYFDGGLPVEPLRAKKLEFPIGQTGQSYRFGTPILPEVLGAFEYKDRRSFVLDGINRLAKNTEPHPPNARFIREIAKLRSEGWDEINAVLFNLLQHVSAPDRDASRLIEIFGSDAEPEGDRDQWLHRFVSRRFRF